MPTLEKFIHALGREISGVARREGGQREEGDSDSDGEDEMEGREGRSSHNIVITLAQAAEDLGENTIANLEEVRIKRMAVMFMFVC